MTATLGIVEVPSPAASSSGTSSPLAARRLGDKSLLEWVVRRVTDSLLLDHVVVVATPDQEREIYSLTPRDVAVFCGPQSDPLARFAAAARQYDASQIIRVSIDNPFVDPVLIDRLICTANRYPRCDYIGYYSNDGQPAVLSRLGVFSEWCRAEAIYRADVECQDPDQRQETTRYLFSHPELFQLRLIPVPPKLDRHDVRLTIHVEEDWDHAQVIFDALGPDDIDWQRIADLLTEHPDLRRRMAWLNRSAVT